MEKDLQRIELQKEQEAPMTARSIGQLAMILSQMGVYKNTYFRGQANINWPISPSLVRQKATLGQILDKEQKLIKDFKEAVQAANLEHLFTFSDRKNPIRTEWEWLDQMQHHRVPTRLIDWTSDYEVALYFATEDTTQDGMDGVIWFVPDMQSLMYLNEKASTFENTTWPWQIPNSALFNMSMNYNKNRITQRGKFAVLSNENLFQPLEKNIEFEELFVKIRIPKEAKKSIREELDKMRISKQYIYPAQNEAITEIVGSVRCKNGFNHK